MKRSWSSLNEREQWFVIFGAGITLCYLLYSLIYAPLTHSLEMKKKTLQEKKELLVWMQTMSQNASNVKKPQTISNSQLLSLIAADFHNPAFKDYPHQLQQSGQGEIQISFPAIPYEAFLQWLWRLHTNYYFNIKSLVVEQGETPGIVKLTLVITL